MEGLDPCDEEGILVSIEDVVEGEIPVDADEETHDDEGGVPIAEVISEEVFFDNFRSFKISV